MEHQNQPTHIVAVTEQEIRTADSLNQLHHHPKKNQSAHAQTEPPFQPTHSVAEMAQEIRNAKLFQNHANANAQKNARRRSWSLKFC
jgi:hypothetical protein